MPLVKEAEYRRKETSATKLSTGVDTKQRSSRENGVDGTWSPVSFLSVRLSRLVTVCQQVPRPGETYPGKTHQQSEAPDPGRVDFKAPLPVLPAVPCSVSETHPLSSEVPKLPPLSISSFLIILFHL